MESYPYKYSQCRVIINCNGRLLCTLTRERCTNKLAVFFFSDFILYNVFAQYDNHVFIAFRVPVVIVVCRAR